jgi:uncharacterized membrane protein
VARALVVVVWAGTGSASSVTAAKRAMIVFVFMGWLMFQTISVFKRLCNPILRRNGDDDVQIQIFNEGA